MLITFLAGILMLVFAVIVHEGGHALAARLCGVGTAEFSIGFGTPRIKLFQIGKMPVYFCLWLLGGYVRLKSRGDESSHEANGKFFEDAALWQKIVILLAGIFANLIAAVILRMIFFIAVPEGFSFKFFVLPVAFAAAPVWYLIPFCAVKSVFHLFAVWFVVVMAGIFIQIPQMIQDIIFFTPTEHSGIIGTIGLASTVHTGLWAYLGTIFYFSILLAVFNLLPIFPLDGGNIVLEILKKVINRFFGEGKIYKAAVWCYRYLGLGIIIILMVSILMSDFKDMIVFFWK